MIEYLEHHIVDHCNLNCAGCSHFSPLAPQWFESIDDFKRDFEVLAKKSQQQIKTIRLMGGEPLLHPDVCEFMRIARILFPYSDIQIVTNGLLIGSRKEELLEACNKMFITVCVSQYGLNLNLQELLKGFIRVRIDGKTNLYNIGLDLNGTQNTQAVFEKCDLHFYRWFYFQDGRFYPCCISANIKHFNNHFNTNLPDNDCSISIHEHSIEEIESFLKHPIPLCKYCNTEFRLLSYSPFHQSNKEIEEWISQ